MDQHLAQRYEDVKLSERAVLMMCDIVSSKNEYIDVLTIFVKILGNKETRKEGITIKKLKEGIEIETNEEPKKLTRHSCTVVINFLLGTSLIYYNAISKDQREKPYFLTSRGVQVCKKLMEHKIMKI